MEQKTKKRRIGTSSAAGKASKLATTKPHKLLSTSESVSKPKTQRYTEDPGAPAADDIDSLFAKIKKTASTKRRQEEQLGQVGNLNKMHVVHVPKMHGSKDDIFGTDTHKGRRRTEEGYPIYSENELHVNQGLGTDLCPFDCKCCF